MSAQEIIVRMFGNFSLVCGDVSISYDSGRPGKTWLLLAYLIWNQEAPKSREDLIRILDEGGNNADPAHSLRLIIWRLRKMLGPISEAAGEEIIINESQKYFCNPHISFLTDAKRFDVLFMEGKKEGEPEGFSKLLKVIDIYQGDFLGKLAGNPWVDEKSAYFKTRYLEALKKAASFLIGRGRQDEASAFCRKALEENPYDEAACRLLMHALMEERDFEGAILIYQRIKDRLRNELDVLPEDETTLLYHEARGVLSGNHQAMVRPEDIRGRIMDDILPDRLLKNVVQIGARICDFSEFRIACQSMAKYAGENGQTVFIGVLSVIPKKGGDLSKNMMSRSMEQLKEQIQKSLRTGDFSSRFGLSQYAFLLIQEDYEHSENICKNACERIVKAFSKKYTRSPARILGEVIPLSQEPLEESPPK